MNAAAGDGTFAAAVSCPSCKNGLVRYLGDSVFTDYAETPQVAELRQRCGGVHWCDRCDLVFRWPVPSMAELADAYDTISVDNWSYEAPSYWGWTREAIACLSPNREVLDVGCFRGDFLNTLDERFHRYGIEPNQQAAQVARGRGVEIIGRFAQERYWNYVGRFGAIVLLDVIEHVHDPAETLNRLKKLLAPRGLFIILTGDSGAWQVRRSLPFYWYMALPTHLVFLGDRYVSWVEQQLDLERLAWRRLAHEKGSLGRRFREWSRSTAIALWRGWLSRSPARGICRHMWPFSSVSRYERTPWLMSTKDHFWAVLRSREEVSLCACA